MSGNGAADGALQGLAVPVGVARVEPPGHESLRSHPLAARLALLSVPYYLPADLADGQLTEAASTVRRWRRQVAEWAELPSRPMAADTAAAIRSAFDELDTVHALALLRDLSLDASTPAGTKFETFLYADRVLGLGLPSEIGQPGA
jgi:cysteinyl-tRNA synthetase